MSSSARRVNTAPRLSSRTGPTRNPGRRTFRPVPAPHGTAEQPGDQRYGRKQHGSKRPGTLGGRRGKQRKLSAEAIAHITIAPAAAIVVKHAHSTRNPPAVSDRLGRSATPWVSSKTRVAAPS